MRGSPELPTRLCRRIMLESASPIALPTVPTPTGARQTPNRPGLPAGSLIATNPLEFRLFSPSWAPQPSLEPGRRKLLRSYPIR